MNQKAARGWEDERVDVKDGQRDGEDIAGQLSTEIVLTSLSSHWWTAAVLSVVNWYVLRKGALKGHLDRAILSHFAPAALRVAHHRGRLAISTFSTWIHGELS